MKTSHRRIALLAGASICALGAAAPAFAAAPHVGKDEGTYPGATTTADTVTICDLATPAGSPCFFGVIDGQGTTPIATANAVVNSTLTGQIIQNPGHVGYLTNDGVAEVGAIANAAAATGNVFASASLVSAVQQVTNYATGDIHLTFGNTGSLLLDASANAAVAGTAAALGNATAY